MLTLKPYQSFSEFKKNFYSTFPDPEIFNTSDFNALKIVMDGLKVNYNDKFSRKTPIFFPFPFNFLFYIAYYFIFNLFKKRIKININSVAKFLFMDYGNFVKINDDYYSFYYHQILRELNPVEYQCFHFSNKIKCRYSENLNLYIFLKFKYNYFHYSTLRKDLKFIYYQIKSFSSFSKRDLRNIKIAFQNFYENVIFYDNLLKLFPEVKKIILNQHYHNESLIYAARKKNISVIELQHGLISSKDIFYVFPVNLKKIRDKALFPDEIWVFGNYWKNELLKGYEYDSKKIYVTGDYRYYVQTVIHHSDELNQIREFINGYQIILITTQTFIHEEYMDYIRFLSEYIKINNLKWKVIVKIHPNEKLENYEKVKNIHSVFITDNINLNSLFTIASVHVSIFSTTLFDALKFTHIKNFSLYSEAYYDYHKQMVDNRVAYSLKKNEFPANANIPKHKLCDPNEIFSTMNVELIKNRLYNDVY